MPRLAFKMKLKPGAAAEYRRRHAEIWPELVAELKAAGVSDYSVFLDEETLTLFAVQRFAGKNFAAEMERSPLVRKWYACMAPLMEMQADHTPLIVPLTEVFHLD